MQINDKLTSKNNQFEQITKTGRKINGKDEYIYYGIIDSLPNASNATYVTPVLMSDIEFVTGFGGTAFRSTDGSWFQFNCFRQTFNDGIGVQGAAINGYMGFYIQTGTDRRSLKGYPWFTFTYKNN